MYTILLATVTLLAFAFFLRNFYIKRRYYKIYGDFLNVTYVLNHLTDGIIELDESQKIIYMNHAAEMLFDIKADDIVGFQVIAEAKAEPQLAPLLEVFFPGKGGETAHTIPKHGDHDDSFQEIIIKKSYEQKLRVFTIPRIDPLSKSNRGEIKIIRDVTQDEIINRNKSDLVTIVSHQLRTPLSGIKWILGALLEGDYGKLTPEQADLVKRGIDANDGLVALVDDMLDVSKIERSEFIYKFQPVEMVGFLKSLVQSKAEEAKAKGITFTERYDIPELSVPIDERRVRIALANLIDNAINYSGPNTSITVVLIKTTSHASISIEDHGIGIPERSREHLFTKFFRADNAQRIRTQGTGLGLFLVKAIVAGHNGTVSFESEEGKGSTFTVSLPLEQKNSVG